MKHRITYIRDNAVEFNPKTQVEVSENSLLVRSLNAAKEHRLTIALEKLPHELSDTVRYLQDLHIRWVSERPFTAPVPFVSRLSPGLHVFLSRTQGFIVDAVGSTLCRALHTAFGEELKCSSVENSFSHPQDSSMPHANSTLQYHSNLSTIASFALYAQRNICEYSDAKCQEASFFLLHADYIEIDFDKQSDTVILSAFWNNEPSGQGWQDKIEKQPKDDKIEVGILNEEKNIVGIEQGEFGLGGWLTVIGDDDHPKPAQFSFPSQHHRISGSNFKTRFDQPTGLHPILRLSLSDTKRPRDTSTPSSCTLHTYITLPSYLFLDRHAFSDPLFLQSHNLDALKSLSGATDLELPDYKIPQWGSAALLAIAAPDSPLSTLDITIPLHLRYLSPTPGGYTNVTMPWPVVFWACPTEHSSESMAGNPFDRVHLGYDSLFEEGTQFWHVNPSLADVRSVDATEGTAILRETITVPVLDTDRSWFVESGTVGISVIGFLWVMWQLLRPIKLQQHQAGRAPNKGETSSKKRQ